MTRIHLGRDEWWPVPDPRSATDDDPDGYEIDQIILDRFQAATDMFNRAANDLARAAADAGDKYWQDNT